MIIYKYIYILNHVILFQYVFRVPYLALARTFELIEDTSGRLRTIEILSNLLRSVIVLTPDDLLHTIYLCLNKVAPAFAGRCSHVSQFSQEKRIPGIFFASLMFNHNFFL